MFLDWETLGYQSAIHIYYKPEGNIKITIALEKYREKKLQKYIIKVKKQ